MTVAHLLRHSPTRSVVAALHNELMRRKKRTSTWAGLLMSGWQALAKISMPLVPARQGKRLLKRTLASAAPLEAERVRPRKGEWITGLALGIGGTRRYRLYRPTLSQQNEKLPMLVMLHGCGQTADSFALSTRMNSVAEREGFMVLYPEQDSLANAHGCWNWFETRSGIAQNEAAIILAAVDQVCCLYPADIKRVALCGLSAGASMGALKALRFPDRFKAVVMHSGVPPGVAQSSSSAVAAMRGQRADAHVLAASALSHAVDLPPLLAIHGMSDQIVSSANSHHLVLAWALAGSTLAPELGGTPAARATPARHEQRGRRHPMRIVDFVRSGVEAVSLIEIDGLGHSWSGGSAGHPFSDSKGPDASRMAWAFIKKHL